jgi:hypothetical protein
MKKIFHFIALDAYGIMCRSSKGHTDGERWWGL